MAGPVATKSEKDNNSCGAKGHVPNSACCSTAFGPYAGIMDLHNAAGNMVVSQLLGAGMSAIPPVVNEVLRSGSGQPLDPITLAEMEGRFGKNFSHVRVHTDVKAVESARAMDAWAYARGSHIVFDEGQYAPQSAPGFGLLEHELTHVVEQQITGPQVQLASKKKPPPPDLDNPATRGIVFERMYVEKVKSYYESKGYRVYINKEWKGWLGRTFKTGVKGGLVEANWGPDLVAIHDGQKKVIAADITATAASPADLRPGDLRKLPGGVGEVEKKAHLEKTIEDARQISRNLPQNLKNYTVSAQDWYREDPRSEKSREVVVWKAGKPVIEIGGVEALDARSRENIEQEVVAVSSSGAKKVRQGAKRPQPSVVAFSKKDLVELFVEKYRLPSPSLEFFQDYKNYDEYEKAFRKRSHDYKKPTPYGWFDPFTKLIHFPPEAALHTQLHETLHWYGAKHHVALNLGSYMNEGLTDWLMRKHLGERMGRHAYDGNVRFVRELAAKIGEKPLMMAFLHGRWDVFHQAMNKQAGGVLNAQKAYDLLSKISGDGKGIENLTGVYELLNLGKAPVPGPPASRTARPKPAPKIRPGKLHTPEKVVAEDISLLPPSAPARTGRAKAGDFQLAKAGHKESFDPNIGERAIEWNTKTGKVGKTEVYTPVYTGRPEKMKPPGGLRSPAGRVIAGGAVGAANLLVAVEEQLKLLANIRGSRLAGSLRTLQWWLQRGVKPPARGVTDRYFQKDVYTTGYSNIASALQEQKLNGIVIDPLEDAQEYEVLAAWVKANIRTWDDFYQHFVLNAVAGVRWHDAKWQLTTWKWSDMPPANVYIEYITDKRVNAIMEPVRRRLLANTEAEIKEGAPSRKKLKFRKGFGDVSLYSPVTLRPLDYGINRGFDPVFYEIKGAQDVPEGYALVTGADVQTYTQIHGIRAYYDRVSPAKITMPGSEWSLVAEDRPFTGWANIDVPVCLVKKDMLTEA